jgi:ankyrin repeat protein
LPLAVSLLSVAILGLPVASASAAEEIVYANDFQSKPGSSFPEWSSSPISYSSKFTPPGSGSVAAPAVTNVESPKGGRRFLGEFGGPRIDPTARTRVRQSIGLALTDLPRHSEATVSFDLLILKSWDGNSAQYGPDRWSLRVKNGPTLIETTFSNNRKVESDRSLQSYPRPGSFPQEGAAAVNTLGYAFFGDSTYHMSISFQHTDDALTLEFTGDLFEGKGTGDESWGLDDVRVSLKAETGPKPARVRRDREQCYDRIVVQHTGPALDYAGALFLLAGATAEPVTQASCMAEDHLVDRIRRILNPEDRTMKLSRAALGLAAGLLLLPAILGMLLLDANRRVMAQERNPTTVGRTSGKKVVMSTHSDEPARELPENPELVGQLKLAIDAKDLDEVKRLMTLHPELHRAPLGYGSNGPLTYAVEWPRRVALTAEKMAILRWMLENGSDVHQGGDGPLMRAALSDSGIPMMELFVEHGADVNALWGGSYPIILAPLEAFAPRSLKWLLDQGADLHAAAKYCCPIEMLTCIYTRRPKDKAACLEIVGAAGFALPDTPVMALHRSRLDLLQKHLDRDPSLLERRFTYGEVFIKHDGTVGDAYPATPVSGCTLLHLALEFDDIDVARWLIERGADVNARAAIDAEGPGGHTPLFHTVANLASGMGLDDDSKARLLLDHGADPNARATFPQEAQFHDKAPIDALHDVTPVGYARRYPDRRCVNAPALAAIIERGGKE